MAPLSADPRQIVITLDPQRRTELLKLTNETILSMKAQLQAEPDEVRNISTDPSTHDENKTTTSDEKVTHTIAPANVEAGKTEALNDSITLFDADEMDESETHADTTDEKSKFSPKNALKNVKIGVPWKTSPGAPGKSARFAEEVQSAARQHMEKWEREFIPKLEEIVHVKDTEKIIAERKTRRQAVEADEKNDNAEQKDEANDDDDEKTALAAIKTLHPPIATPLTTNLSEHDRRETLSCILLLLLSTGKYSAHSRVLLLRLASSLDIPHTFLNHEEVEVAESLIEQSTASEGKKEHMTAEAEAAKRQQENKISRYWKVGLASVAGATIIGVTGGLAAPLVAGAVGSILGGVGLGGVASFLGIFWMNGALVGALFGAYGAKMTGSMMDKYAKEVEDFKFIPLHDSTTAENPTKEGCHRRLRVTIGINGWLNSEADVTRPWAVLPRDTEVFALRYEMQTLLALGTALGDLVHSLAWKAVQTEVIKRTVLATLWAALWPMQVLAVASAVDNPFARAANRSRKAGRLLADALVSRVQGERPVVLVGYSLGAAAVHACLAELAARRAFGVVDTVVIVGAPAPADPAHWRALAAVVAGRVVNVYSDNDMVLGYVHRMHSLSLGVAGLQPIRGVVGVDNLDLSDRVSGHLRYPDLIGAILRECGFVGVRGAASEIEKDHLIVLKDEYAAGNAVDVDGTTMAPDKTPRRGSGEMETGEEKKEEEGKVPPPLPRRPINKNLSDAEKPMVRRKPVPAPTLPRQEDQA